MNTVIELEDNGQDFLEMVTDEDGVIIETRPFQTSIWKGGIIPIHVYGMVEVDKPLPIHHPPNIKYGFLKHRIKSVRTEEAQVENELNT